MTSATVPSFSQGVAMSEPVLFPFIGSAIEVIALLGLGLVLLLQLPRFTQGLRSAVGRLRSDKPRAPVR